MIEFEPSEDGIHVRVVDTETGVRQVFRISSPEQNAASAAYKRSSARLSNAAADYLEARSASS